jgi:hypothetical protein
VLSFIATLASSRPVGLSQALTLEEMQEEIQVEVSNLGKLS